MDVLVVAERMLLVVLAGGQAGTARDGTPVRKVLTLLH